MRRFARSWSLMVVLLAACSEDGADRPDAAVDVRMTDATADRAVAVPLDGAVDVPAACVGTDPSAACRVLPTDCLPSACSCSGGEWVCTADCAGGRSCDDAGITDAAADARARSDAPPADLCTSTGGTVRRSMCCLTTTEDYPDLCSVGACGCAPTASHERAVCSCPAGACFSPERGCVRPVCTPGMDQTCNDDPRLSSVHGRCLQDRTCDCSLGWPMNPATGKCL